MSKKQKKRKSSPSKKKKDFMIKEQITGKAGKGKDKPSPEKP
jgi:hypothetical protein